MKRNGLLFVATLLLSVFSLCLVACSDSNNNTEGDNTPHAHDYKIEKSETMHWLKCDCGDTKDYNVHSGGTATCVAKAECSVCGETYGELGEHNYGDWVSNGDNTHTKTCSNDNNHKITENCNGGTATCAIKAVCTDCKTSYGPLKNHPVEDWTTTETHHYQQTTCSCNLKLNYGEHQTDDSGFCTSCDKAINPTVGILYYASSDGTYAEVIGYNGTSTKINIASNYNNLHVKSIYKEAFKYSSIKSVVIPDSVTSIGDEAFYYCRSLTRLSITNGQ